MADHFLTQVVAGVKTKLTSPTVIASIGSAAKVFTADDYPRDPALGSWINVYSNGFQRENATSRGAGRPGATNLIDLRVQCVAVGKGSARAAAIAIAKEVEQRWLGTTADERLSGIMTRPLHRAQCMDIDVRIDADADTAYAVAEMTFQVTVLSLEGSPDLT